MLKVLHSPSGVESFLTSKSKKKTVKLGFMIRSMSVVNILESCTSENHFSINGVHVNLINSPRNMQLAEKVCERHVLQRKPNYQMDLRP